MKRFLPRLSAVLSAMLTAVMLTSCAADASADAPPSLPPVPAPPDTAILTPLAKYAAIAPMEMSAANLPTDALPDLYPLPASVTTNIEEESIRKMIERLAAHAKAWGLAISYISGDGAWRVSVNGDKMFPSASTVKAIYSQYLLASGADLSREIVFETELERTSDILTEEKKGSVYTASQLMEWAVVESDNMAYRLLFSAFGRTGYNRWIASLGIPELQFPTAYEFMDVSADALSRGTLEIYRRGESDRRLVELMLRSKNNVLIASGTKHPTAAKYGFEGGYLGYHDTAIVYAPAPYVLTVMSNLWAESAGVEQVFAIAASLTDAIHTALIKMEQNKTEK